MTPPTPDDDLAVGLLRFFCSATRTDLGLSPVDRDVPVGTWFADALRCRVMAWCEGTTGPPELVDQVASLGHVMANLIEGAGHG